MNLSSVISSTGLSLLFCAVQALSLTLLTSSQCFSNPAAEHTVNSSDVERWVESGMDEVRRLAAPVPQLLFSHPVWLTGEELRPFQERLTLDAKLTDLTHMPGMWNQAFAELLTTEGLLITERPNEPVQGNYWLHYSYYEDKLWESLWRKPLPVPSVIRSTAFTRELLQEDSQLPWNATRRFCSFYRICRSIMP